MVGKIEKITVNLDLISNFIISITILVEKQGIAGNPMVVVFEHCNLVSEIPLEKVRVVLHVDESLKKIDVNSFEEEMV